MVSCLMFKSLSHFEFILCMLWGSVLVSLIYMQLCSFPSTTCWRDSFCPILYSCLFKKLIDHICLGLFLGALFCSIDPYSHLCTNPHCFDFFSFVRLSEILENHSFFFNFSYWMFWQFWVFYCSIQILDYSISLKKYMGNLIEITWNL